ncbi:hypothetical protein [Streptomyces mirabilis]|uniref:hypothetical protein n=1 Tax=Streptomyces mirabilis TaxID=68239 RepID=UPI0036A4536A
MSAEPVGVAGDAIDARREVGVVGRQIRARGRQGGDEGSCVVVGEGSGELDGRGAGGGGEIRERGDLAGELAKVRGVGPGPGGDGAVGGAAVAGGLYPLLARGPGVSGAYAQVAAFCGLAAGDAEGVGEVGPAGACLPGLFDQARFPLGELIARFAEQQERGECLLRAGLDGSGALPVPRCPGGAQGLVDRVQRRGGGEEGRGGETEGAGLG